MSSFVIATAENCFIYACISAIVLGFYWMGHGGVGWWSLTLLLCVNYINKPA